MLRFPPLKNLSVGWLMVCVIVMSNTHLNAKEVIIEPPSSCSFYGDFQQTKSIKGLDKPIETSGVFFYSCEHGVIWKTLLPVTETLVLNKDGKSSKVEDDQASPIKSRQGKLLGQLINGLIGANQDFIDKNFDVVSTKIETTNVDTQKNLLQQSYILNPKRRRLQRALTRIELLTPLVDINSQHAKDDDNIVSISLLDRNQQWTHIESSKRADYPRAENSLNQCMQSNIFSLLECGLLARVNAS